MALARRVHAHESHSSASGQKVFAIFPDETQNGAKHICIYRSMNGDG